MFPCDGVHSLFSPLPDVCLETIDTDRPHQTDTPHVLPAGHTQVESAVTELELGGTVDGVADPYLHAVFFDDNYKFGLVTGVDLQVLFKHADYVPALVRFAAPGPLEMRVKIALVEEKGAVPAITLVPWVWIPFASTEPFRVGAFVFWGWSLPHGFELEMNAGVIYAATPAPLVPVLASALTHQVIGPMSAFIDVYATGPNVQLGLGALVPVTRDVQVDAGMYVGLTGAVYRATPFVGLSLRR